jgi:hypothetical protein
MLFSVFLFAEPTSRTGWTKEDVEAAWGHVDTGTFSDIYYSFDVGWEPTDRFYAVPANGTHVVNGGITIVDRIHRRSCAIPTATFSTGRWIQSADGTPTGYEAHTGNQYGLSVGYQLNLSSWLVTETTTGECPMSPNDCHPVDPPLVSTRTCAPS